MLDGARAGVVGGECEVELAEAVDHLAQVARPGERVDVDNPPPVDGWWQQIT